MGAVANRTAISGRVSTSNRVATASRKIALSRQDGAFRWVGDGLVAYYISNSDSITLDNSGKVSQWDDISTNDRHMLQATSARRPTYANGVVTFSGSQCLTLASNLQTTNNNVSMGVVFQSTTNTGGTHIIFRPSVTGGTSFFINSLGTGKREVNDNGVATLFDGNATTNREVWIETVAASGAVSSLFSLFTGTAKTPQTLTPNTAGKVTPSGNSSSIGGNPNGQFGLIGNISEIFFVNRLLSSSEITTYLADVAAKYGAI